jgi:hypothetical protein
VIREFRRNGEANHACANDDHVNMFHAISSVKSVMIEE